MRVGKTFAVLIAVLAFLVVLPATLNATPRKVHVVGLGAVKRVPYSTTGDPAGAAPGEVNLKIRPLVVDGVVKEWTSGESHDVTDRSFVVRRVLRINDELPGEKPANAGAHWVWQRGPWLLVDRVTGHIAALKLPDYDPGVSQVTWFRDYAAYCGVTASGKSLLVDRVTGHIAALKLPDYDPGVSQVTWFRDYAAYCGVTASGKSLYAVVAQLAVRKPVLAKKIDALDPAASRTEPACGTPEWQREPLRATFHPAGKDAISFDIVLGSAVLVEDSEDRPEAAPAGKE